MQFGKPSPIGYLTPERFGAVGDGVTDDRVAILNMLNAAGDLGGLAECYFGPKTYIVSRSSTNGWSIDLPYSNITLRGHKGRTWIKHPPGMPNASVCIMTIDQKTNVTIENVGFDGGWDNVVTLATVAGVLPLATITVASTTGFPSSGTCTVISDTGSNVITYTGITATTFTGCSGGSGNLVAGASVGYVDAQTGINHTDQGDPKNYGVMIRGSTHITMRDCIVRKTYGDGIWVGTSRLSASVISFDVLLDHVNVDMTARDGIAFGNGAERVRVLDCNFTNIYAQAWDMEPVGSFEYLRDVTADRCTFDTWWNPANSGRSVNAPVSIMGGDPLTVPALQGRARKIRMRDCTINGSVIISGAQDVIVDGCEVVCDWDGFSYAPIDVTGWSDDVTINDNRIYARTRFQSGNSAMNCISVAVAAVSSTNSQPQGITVSNNKVKARNDATGILIYGPGGHDYAGAYIAGDTGTATATTITTLTDSGKSWTTNQWVGYFVRRGTAIGTVSSNTATALTITAWTTWRGAQIATPAAGAYTLLNGGGMIDVYNNTIDCSNDGPGSGGPGISINASAAGGRIRVRRNTIQNAVGAAIPVTSQFRTTTYLELSENYAYDNQQTPTTTNLFSFNTPGNILKLVIRANSKGDGVTAEGLPTSGVWLIEDGDIQRWAGYGYPNGLITANIGSTFHRLDAGGSRALWVKQSGTGNTGWVGLSRPNVLPWTVDEGSGWGIPQTLTEWIAVIAAAGLTGVVPPPDACWPMQDPNGSLLDVIGGYHLAASGTGLAYLQAVSGWASGGAFTTDNSSGRWSNSDSGLPDLSTGALTMIAFAIIETANNVNRMLMGAGTTQMYIGGSTGTRVADGANVATEAGSEYGVVRPYGIQHNAPGLSCFGFDDLAKVTPTFSASVTGKRITAGGLSGVLAPPTAIRLFQWAWFSAPSAANIKKILQVLNCTIAWS